MYFADLYDLHDIHMEWSANAVIVTPVYSELSTAKETLILFLSVMDNTKSYLLLLGRNTHSCMLHLDAGNYSVIAHGTGSNGMLPDGIGFPAVTKNLVVDGDQQGT